VFLSLACSGSRHPAHSGFYRHRYRTETMRSACSANFTLHQRLAGPGKTDSWRTATFCVGLRQRRELYERQLVVAPTQILALYEEDIITMRSKARCISTDWVVVRGDLQPTVGLGSEVGQNCLALRELAKCSALTAPQQLFHRRPSNGHWGSSGLALQTWPRQLSRL
jgi:hypothetical protein